MILSIIGVKEQRSPVRVDSADFVDRLISTTNERSPKLHELNTKLPFVRELF
jgi:hypothetical protein